MNPFPSKSRSKRESVRPSAFPSFSLSIFGLDNDMSTFYGLVTDTCYGLVTDTCYGLVMDTGMRAYANILKLICMRGMSRS